MKLIVNIVAPQVQPDQDQPGLKHAICLVGSITKEPVADISTLTPPITVYESVATPYDIAADVVPVVKVVKETPFNLRSNPENEPLESIGGVSEPVWKWLIKQYLVKTR